MKCPKCHFENSDTQRFCGECGTQLFPSDDISASLTKTLETPTEELTRGSTFAERYEIIERLGKGGMGTVYRVFDKKIKEEVALKLLNPEIAADKKTIERFSNELKFARKITHKNVCRMHDLHEEEKTQYITMEYVPGEDLKSLIRRTEKLTVGKAVSIAKQVCEGLDEAHRLGVVHRDLKPQNIMIDKEGNAKIMDFGIARSLKAKGVTGEGMIVGTPDYMSPEQVDGKEADQRSDLYSLGVILFEMVTGRVPFEGDTPLSIAVKHKSEAPPTPKKLNLQIPENLSRVILKCMEKEKGERYQDAEELIVELENIEKGLPTTERIVPKRKTITSREITLKFNLKRLFIPAFSIMALAIIVTTIVWITKSQKAVSPKEALKPISILIADFENQTSDPVFDGAIEHALSLGIKGASFISSYNRSSARKVANQLDPKFEGRLDDQIAQAVCRREGIDLVIAGSVELSGKGYIINVWALHPTQSEKISQISREINKKTDVLKETDKLATQLASELGGVKLRYKGRITTGSLEAMNAYSKALKFEKEGKDKEAIQEYLRSIKEDPEFGHAYGNLAIVYYNIGQEQTAKEYFEMAMAHMDRMTEEEKNTIRAKYYLIFRNYKKAIDLFSELLKQNPKNYWARSNRALAYFFARDMKRALEEEKKALELVPKSLTARFNLIWYAIGAGDFELAEKEARAFVNEKPDYGDTYICLALVELIQGRTTQANEVYQKLKNLSPYGASYADIGLADLALYKGRLSDAKQMLEEGISSDIENNFADFAAEKLIMLGQTLLLQGKEAPAIEAAERALESSKKESVLFSATQIFISAGREDRAMALINKLAEKIYPEYQSYVKLLEGEVKLLEDDIHSALKLFQEAQSLLNTWLSQYALGRAYLEARAYIEAHEAFELCLKRRGEASSIFFDDLPSYRYLPTVYYYLGRAQEGLKMPGAVESYKTFLSIKEKGEVGALVEDARRRLQGLSEKGE